MIRVAILICAVSWINTMKSSRTPDTLTFSDAGKRHVLWIVAYVVAIILIVASIPDMVIYIDGEAVTLVSRIVFILPLAIPLAVLLVREAHTWNPREISFDKPTRTLVVRSRRLLRKEEQKVGFDDIAQVYSSQSHRSTDIIVRLTDGTELYIERDNQIGPAARASSKACVEAITRFLAQEPRAHRSSLRSDVRRSSPSR